MREVLLPNAYRRTTGIKKSKRIHGSLISQFGCAWQFFPFVQAFSLPFLLLKNSQRCFNFQTTHSYFLINCGLLSSPFGNCHYPYCPRMSCLVPSHLLAQGYGLLTSFLNLWPESMSHLQRHINIKEHTVCRKIKLVSFIRDKGKSQRREKG